MNNCFIKIKYKTYYKKDLNFLYFFNKIKNFKYFHLPTKNKYFIIMKSPKCYKISKILLKYSYKIFFFKFIKKLPILYSNRIINFFNCIKFYYIKYQLTNTKLFKLEGKFIIKYNFNIF